jgi:ribosomal protein L11 methyltransferase
MNGLTAVTALDIDAGAIAAARRNAAANGVDEAITFVQGDIGAVDGVWPLIVANVLAAPLMDMAPTLVRRVAHRGRLVLSGIGLSMAPDVERIYRRLGMRHVRTDERGGWAAIVLDASW